MPISIQWLVPDHVIFVRYSATVTADEINHASQTAVTMMSASPKPLVHTLYDMSQLETVPANIAQVADAARVYMTHERLGWMIFVALRQPLLRFMGTMVTKVFQSRYRLFDTEAEARAFLLDMDSTLQALPPFASVPPG